MRVLLALLVVGLSTLAPAAATSGAAPVAYVVGFDALPADRASFHGERVAGVHEGLRFLVVHARDAAAFEARARGDAGVRYVEPDADTHRISLVPNDTHYNGYQYDLKPATTNISGAWDTTLGSSAVKVAVVDTGQYRSHQDFAGASWGPWRDFVNGRSTAYDDHGHGTHVTGTIGAVTNNGNGIAGIAQATLLGAKVCAKSGFCSTSAIAGSITWSADNGAHVISLSLGGPYSQAVADAVSYASGAGALVVAAAGNGGPCADCVAYPGALPLAVAVGCTDASNAQCSFSSEGPELDLAAPGKDIASTWPGVYPCQRKSTNCYVLASGTSMSTPHVSGLAALVKAANPAFTNTDLRARLEGTARDLGAAGWDEKFGRGLIQGSAVAAPAA